MKNFNELQEFIRSNKDWKERLKSAPFNLKSVTPCPYHEGWWMLVYNLFRSELSNPIVKQCRGTVVDEDGNIICAPYLKFFNYGDAYADEIDWSTAVVREKIDGQLIKMFRYDGQTYWVTNGGWNPECLELSYQSPFENGKSLLEFAIGDSGWCDNVPDGWTLMFELTSPYNQIICEYSEPKLWFHGCRNNEGEEVTPLEAVIRFRLNYDIPKIIPSRSISELTELLNTWNGMEQEGVVVCDRNWHRIKIKCKDYLKLKFEKCLNSPKTLWKLWAEGEWDDMYGEAKEKIIKFNDEVNELLHLFSFFYGYTQYRKTNLKKTFDNEREIRKSFAQDLISNHEKSPFLKYMFLAYDRTLPEFNESILYKFRTSWKEYKLMKELTTKLR